MNDFDRLARRVFSTVSNLMGEVAVWQSSNSKEITGRVLFKNPTESTTIGDSEGYEYRPNTTTVEYHADTFAGLKESVDATNSEFIIVRENRYLIIEITTKFDGNTHVAHLELTELTEADNDL